MLIVSALAPSAEPAPPKKTAAPEEETTAAQSNSAPEKTAETKTVASQSPSPALEPQKTVALKPVETKTEVTEVQAREAAERRIESDRFRALIDNIAPVANSPERASKSYMSSLLTPAKAAEDVQPKSELGPLKRQEDSSQMRAL